MLEAGLRTFPISIGAFLTAPFAGRLAGRIGPRLPIVLEALLDSGALFLLMRLEPDSSYATLWWILAMLGIGFGFMLSPLAAAVLSATPAARAGLGSSMFSTSNRIGNTLGIAVLGAFVVQQFSGNISSQLTQQGVPASISAMIAKKIAAAGAQGSQLPLSGRLPLPYAALHQAINQAFVDALHGSFLISGIAFLTAALLVAFFFQQKQRSLHLVAQLVGWWRSRFSRLAPSDFRLRMNSVFDSATRIKSGHEPLFGRPREYPDK